MSATSTFFQDFFPTAAAALAGRSGGAWALLQPARGAASLACGELRLAGLRNPTLVPFQLAGALLGLRGGRALLARSRDRRRGASAVHSAYEAYALLCYAAMCATSLACHALLPRLGPAWRLFRLLDVVFTGASCLCVMLSQSQHAGAGRQGGAAARDAAIRRCHAVLACVLLLGALGEGLRVPWTNELLYILTIGMCSAATCHYLLRSGVGGAAAGGNKSIARQAAFRRHAVLALVGLNVMLFSLPLDASLCAVAGPWFGTVQALFLGSDLAFAGLLGCWTA